MHAKLQFFHFISFIGIINKSNWLSFWLKIGSSILLLLITNHTGFISISAAETYHRWKLSFEYDYIYSSWDTLSSSHPLFKKDEIFFTNFIFSGEARRISRWCHVNNNDLLHNLLRQDRDEVQTIPCKWPGFSQRTTVHGIENSYSSVQLH